MTQDGCADREGVTAGGLIHQQCGGPLPQSTRRSVRGSQEGGANGEVWAYSKQTSAMNTRKEDGNSVRKDGLISADRDKQATTDAHR